jgi:DedD protein
MPQAEPAKNAKPAATPAETVKAAAATAAPPVAPKPEKTAEAAPELVKPAASKEHKPAAAPIAEKAKSAAKPAENGVPTQDGFVVRLGAFAKPDNAKQLKAKLTSMGIRNYSDVLKTASGDKHRVRAGPYASKREAESVRERLKAVDIVGDVVPKP